MSEQNFRPLFPALAILLTPFDTMETDSSGAGASSGFATVMRMARKGALNADYWKPLGDFSKLVALFTEEYLARYPHKRSQGAASLPTEVREFLNLLSCMEIRAASESVFHDKAQRCRGVALKIANG